MENQRKGNFGWGVLGFFFPVVGLILFLVWKNNKKEDAKVAAIGAIIGAALTIVLTVACAVLVNLGLIKSKKIINEPTPVVTPKSDEEKSKCTGTATKGTNKYEYKFDIESADSVCKSITYKVNDDFTVEFDISDGTNQTSYLMFVNGKEVEVGRYEDDKFYVVGKTFITTEFSTDLGANVLLFNTKGEIYNLVQEGEEAYNPVNQLKVDKMTVKDYKVNEDGSLTISALRHSNQCEFGHTIDGKCASDSPCDYTFEQYMNKYNVSLDYDYSAEFTFKQNNDGLYEFNSTKNVTKTYKDFFNEYKTNSCR
ncbi:MAG: hypothetical protein IKZ96_01005 [Bacilli bacterium]|nr:hypothetical protein [Bacilli bacterium]